MRAAADTLQSLQTVSVAAGGVLTDILLCAFLRLIPAWVAQEEYGCVNEGLETNPLWRRARCTCDFGVDEGHIRRVLPASTHITLWVWPVDVFAMAMLMTDFVAPTGTGRAATIGVHPLPACCVLRAAADQSGRGGMCSARSEGSEGSNDAYGCSMIQSIGPTLFCSSWMSETGFAVG